MLAHVICFNDGVEAVVIDDIDFANSELERLKNKYYEKVKFQFENREQYDQIVYWHIHSVKLLVKK
jgi:hypothetical protein